MVGWKQLFTALLYMKVLVPSFEWCKLAFSQTSTEEHTREHGDIFRSKDGCRIFSLPNYVGNYVSAMAASFASYHSWQWTQKVTWLISTACENAGTFGVSHLNWWLKCSQLLSMPLGSLLPQQAHLESLPTGMSAGCFSGLLLNGMGMHRPSSPSGDPCLKIGGGFSQ